MPEERRDRIEAKIDSLSSRVDEVDAAVHKLTILHEETRDDEKRIAEGLAGTGGRFDRIERSIDEIKWAMKSFIQTQSVINGKLSSRDADRGHRIGVPGKRRT